MATEDKQPPPPQRGKEVRLSPLSEYNQPRMEIIRRETDYAVRCLVTLAGSHRPVPCALLAKSCGIPQSFAYKLLKKMVRAGLLTSFDGRAGGFSLKKDPQDISLLAVSRAIQGTPVVRKCVLNRKSCPRSSACSLSCRWKELQGQILKFLEQNTISTLLAPHG